MLVLALDLSTAKSGWALARDGEVELCGLWKSPSKLKAQHEKIEFMAEQVAAVAAFARPDLVVIEECGPQRNAKTFRALVRVEAICAHECRKLGIEVLLVMVKAVREVAFGDGKTGKVTAYHKMKAAHPQFDWPENDETPGKEGDKGGNDMSDALAMSIAGPRLADRR